MHGSVNALPQVASLPPAARCYTNVSMKTKLKTVLGPVIIAVTIVIFAYYIKHHPEILAQLRQLPPLAVVVLLGLYTLSFLVYAAITRISLRMYGKTLSRQENILFNAYSSLINFFGPGQSGPVFRGAYLKKRHNLAVKQFVFVTLLYLGFFAMMSVMLMFVGSRPWWQTMLLVIVVGAASWLLAKRYKKRSHIETGPGLNAATISALGIAIALQIALLATIYGFELRQVDAHASLGQVLSYTGVANFSLFVALTPGAVGIREAFLVFSQHLHHINAGTIVAANIVDRSVYLLFLGLLFVLVMSLHAKDKLNVRQLKTGSDD